MRLRVYWNIRKRCYSVQHQVHGQWRVRNYVHPMHFLPLEDVKFHVSQKGRQRVLDSGHKNVHAWLEGTYTPPPRGIITTDELESLKRGWKVTYNPFRDTQFRTPEGDVYHADRAIICFDGTKPCVYIVD